MGYARYRLRLRHPRSRLPREKELLKEEDLDRFLRRRGRPGDSSPPSTRYERVELLQLVTLIRDSPNGAQHSLCHGATVESLERGENLFPDLRCKPQLLHDLSHVTASNALPVRNFGLAGDLSGFQLVSPRAHRGDQPGRHGRSGNRSPARPTRDGFAICNIWRYFQDSP